MAQVALRKVVKMFDKTPAVQGIDLDIADREFVVLVGPSGCGKTTTLRMVAGLEEASAGEIYIGDQLVNDVPPKDRDIAMVFQNYALYPHMTVFENMSFGLRLRKFPKTEIKERVENAARILDITPLLERQPKQLSGGQRQRVAMGRAIVRNPKVFLFDEPLSNLDAKLRVQMRTEIKKVHQKVTTTTIYVTHDQVEAMTMGDRIAVMNRGVLQQVGTPEELYTQPVNVFVAGFIGSPSMNLVPVEAASDGGKPVLRHDGLDVELPERLAQVVADTKRLVVGFRPEHLELGDREGGGDMVRIPAEIDVVEYLGDEQLLHLHAGEVDLVARVGIEPRAKAGQSVNLVVPPDKLHVFDAESDDAIPLTSR
jgi:multiple sugar transport system ATP-binding protein